MKKCVVCGEELVEVEAGYGDEFGLCWLPGFDRCARCGYDGRYDWNIENRPEELAQWRAQIGKPHQAEIEF